MFDTRIRELRVLIADDDVNLRQLLVEFVRALTGTEPETACNGRQAVDKVNEGQPTLVLLDMMMPGLSGFEAAAQIKAGCPAAKIIGLSAGGNRAAALANGCDDFLSKPFDVDELEQKVVRWAQVIAGSADQD